MLDVMWLNDEIRAGTISAAILLAVGFTLGMVEGAAAQLREEPAAVVGNPPTRIGFDRLSATRERPLFSPSRRPPPVAETRSLPPPPAPIAAKAPPNLTFFGTFESAEEVGAAVQVGPHERATVIRFGSYIEGWRVTEISRDRLVLSFDDRTAVFSLFSPKNSSVPPPAVSQDAKQGEQPPQPRRDGNNQNVIKHTNNR